MSRITPVFISFEQVLELHAKSLECYGGTAGIRDRGQVQSALGAAQSAFWYTGDLFRAAATYAYCIAQNQAFLDGNKRTGVLAAVVFLKLNGYTIPTNTEVLYEAMIRIANKGLSNEQLAELLKSLSVPE